jgi:hypothetical protein
MKWLDKMPGRNRDQQRDELEGTWEIGADDVSGLHGILWSFAIIFYKEGRGEIRLWQRGSSLDEKPQPFVWHRLGDQKISARLDNEEETIIEYDISDYEGPYSSRYKKLVEVGKDKFWQAEAPLYRQA